MNASSNNTMSNNHVATPTATTTNNNPAAYLTSSPTGPSPYAPYSGPTPGFGYTLAGYSLVPTHHHAPVQYYVLVQQTMAHPLIPSAQPVSPSPSFGHSIVPPAQQAHFGSPTATIGSMGPTVTPGLATALPHVLSVGTIHDPSAGAWNMDTGASSHLNDSVTSLSDVFNTCIYPSVSVGDGHTIPVTNTGH
ncbi:hypothetical protein Tco_0069439, partial [Tanacetum coccineum]